ncbi:MAG: glycosyltransferase, partial [Candidatus Omnitrophota bacterium]
WDVRLLWDIMKIRQKYRCKIINTHFARTDIFGVIVGAATHVPVVKYVHGMAWNDSHWLQKIDGRLSPLRMCTLCNSEATRRVVISQTGAKNTKVIYNGVPNHAVYLTPDQRSLKRNELDLPQDAFVIIHVGGMIASRDQSVIIQAVQQCVETGINAYLVFVGDGPLRKRLESEIHDLGLTQRTRFLGYRRDVFELNAMSDVFVNMAREEGFGIAVVEAMQAGLPVVLANAGALPELIEDGVSGLLVAAGDSDNLAAALQRLVNEAALKKKLGEKARWRAESNFSISRYVKDMEQLYAEVVSGDT